MWAHAVAVGSDTITQPTGTVFPVTKTVWVPYVVYQATLARQLGILLLYLYCLDMDRLFNRQASRALPTTEST